MNLKVTDVLNRFNGDGNISVWLKLAHLAKSLFKLKDLFTFIYIYISGVARPASRKSRIQKNEKFKESQYKKLQNFHRYRTNFNLLAHVIKDYKFPFEL